ncbi:MAG: VanZ family protein [Ignavibacteriaceae bacterium]|nr:VanZ family protein [Ignavibacteriaceae bacterium]MCW8812851.1 VanZ family protein [Chlorobium sp.]MCW8817937.1 VanZ family protein [Ignavibacteriaceae bacterium]MCW8960564.1 VanZ family protein [Ignavibacteriaceae bacterium]MCW9095799.1 VanZ family protein [Ignavibacteriaceae bacterium]
MFEYLEKRKVMFVYFPLTLYWIILFTATTLPGKDLPELGISDKIEHFSAFFILAVLLNLALIYQRKSYFLFKNASIATIIITLLYGAIDEIHQLFISGRSADIRDWFADSSGVIIGILLLNLLKRVLDYKINFE